MNWYKKAKLDNEILLQANVMSKIPLWLSGIILSIISMSGISNLGEKILKYKEDNTRLSQEQKETLDSIARNESFLNQLKIDRENFLLQQKNTQQPKQPTMQPTRLEQQPKQNVSAPKTEISKVEKPKTEKAESLKTKKSKVNIDQIIKAIIEHEGLVDKQLPMRITNPTMRKWDTYLGFKLMNDDSKKPANRKNFLFLEDASQVPQAIKKQIQRYNSDYQTFGFHKPPTLKDAIKKFDQDKPQAKMTYIKNKFPSVDFNKSLEEYL